MANWERISRNAKTHGDFAGRTQAEQDAYFAFFAGPEPCNLKDALGKMLSLVSRAQQRLAAHSLHRRTIKVASLKSIASK